MTPIFSVSGDATLISKSTQKVGKSEEKSVMQQKIQQTVNFKPDNCVIQTFY